MSTNATIARHNKDGSIDEIYLHWDGYPEHAYEILKQHYTTQEKVDELIALGDLSVLAKNTDVKSDMPVPEGVEHTYDTPVKDVCIAYGRDRGETGTEAKNVPMLQVEDFRSYAYVWSNGTWYAFHRGKHIEGTPVLEAPAKRIEG